jgi:3-oxoacyl-[acyl-carrier protein] reductase
VIELTDRVVLVTGASRGIGAATARTLGAAGADVIVHYGRDREAAAGVAAAIGEGRCALVQADLAAPGTGSALWDQALAWRGHIDVVVNNAAIALTVGVDDPLSAWTAAWERTLRVNVIAVADICRAAILHFRARGGGTIINISSRAAFRGDTPDYMHYAASKGAVVALTKSIARGFGRDGVLAYGIAPGWVRTDMAEVAVRAHGLDALTRDIPLGDMAPPEEVANVVAFLASGLARHATGTTIDINGASYVR